MGQLLRSMAVKMADLYIDLFIDQLPFKMVSVFSKNELGPKCFTQFSLALPFQ